MYSVSGGPKIATSHSKRLSSLTSFTQNPSTGSSCKDLYSTANARTALQLVLVAIFLTVTSIHTLFNERKTKIFLSKYLTTTPYMRNYKMNSKCHQLKTTYWQYSVCILLFVELKFVPVVNMRTMVNNKSTFYAD